LAHRRAFTAAGADHRSQEFAHFRAAVKRLAQNCAEHAKGAFPLFDAWVGEVGDRKQSPASAPGLPARPRPAAFGLFAFRRLSSFRRLTRRSIG
jgi:hypothetical protein